MLSTELFGDEYYVFRCTLIDQSKFSEGWAQRGYWTSNTVSIFYHKSNGCGFFLLIRRSIYSFEILWSFEMNINLSSYKQLQKLTNSMMLQSYNHRSNEIDTTDINIDYIQFIICFMKGKNTQKQTFSLLKSIWTVKNSRSSHDTKWNWDVDARKKNGLKNIEIV